MTGHSKPRWLRALNVIFLVVGVSALAIIIHQLGWDKLESAVRRVGFGFVFILLLHLGDVALDSFILQRCAGTHGASTGYRVFLHASLAGHAINEAVPFNSVGEVTKYNLMREHIPGHAAAAALVVQNLIRFVTMSVFIAMAAPVTLLILEPSRVATIALIITSAVFIIAGSVSLWLLFRGIGELPLTIARKVGFSADRVDRWRNKWGEVAGHWETVAGNGVRLRSAWLASIIARSLALAESALILHYLGVDNLFAMALLTMANYQVVVWATSFIPFQAGTTEGGAYFLYKAVGLSAQLGVVVELIRRTRRAAFIALGVLLLAVKSVRPPRSEES